MKVSVIIPCYNMKDYLSECLDSIFEQSLQDVEVICIDDGSTDGTQELLEKYQTVHGNIVLLCQKNQGAGCARNKGIQVARGEFIAFMDADDFYPERDILEYMYGMATKEDAVICGGSYCSYRNGVYTYTGFRKGMIFERSGWIKSNDFPTFVGYWRFIFRRNFLLENEIWFPNYLRGQDLPFFETAIAKANKVYCLEKITYCYRKEHKKVFFDERRAVDYAKSIRDCLEIALREGLEKIYATWLKELHGEISALLYYFAYKGSEEMKEIIQAINCMLEIENAENSSNVKLFMGDEITSYVQGVNEEYIDLLKRLASDSKILIYGAGTVGRKVLDFLKKNDCEPEAFVVSDIGQNPREVEGVEVKSIEEFIAQAEECFVIIATFSYLHEEITKNLVKMGYKNFYPIDMEKFYLWCGEIVH